MPTPTTRAVVRIAAVALFAVAAAACASTGDNADDGDEAARPVEYVITVTASGRSFDPAEVTVPAGKVVQIDLVNTDADTQHRFFVENLNVQRVEQPVDQLHGDERLEITAFANTTRSMVFVAEGDGRFRFICTVEGHAEAGMVGTFVLEAAAQ